MCPRNCLSTRTLFVLLSAFLTFEARAQTSSTHPSIVYAEITSTLTSSGSPAFEPIPGLTLTLPASNAQYNIAIVTLDLPNLHLNQPNDLSSPLAGQVEIVAPFSPAGIVFADGTISTDIPRLQQSGKKPVTIVLRVPLGSGTQSVMAEWATVNGIINTDTFGSFSAILGRE